MTGILDTILDAKVRVLDMDFRPETIVEKLLAFLKERDRKVLAKRHGLLGEEKGTLESIGKDLKLTRERVRQIEKQLIADLKKRVSEVEDFQKHSDLVHATITSHGGLMAEADLLEKLGVQAVAEANAVKFLLALIDGVEEIGRNGSIKNSWKTLGFDEEVLKSFLKDTHDILEKVGKPHGEEKLLELLKSTDVYAKHSAHLTDQVMRNFLKVSHTLGKNPLGEYGLQHWPEVNPRDVGDKAYLALKHHGKPLHYTEITKLINNLGFDNRKAHDETAHNELIKDNRFVLVGRGIYGLLEWGYKPGVVSDVIEEVLKEHAGNPVKKDDLVSEVMSRRMVKRNTVLVSLANKKKFKKVGKDSFVLA